MQFEIIVSTFVIGCSVLNTRTKSLLFAVHSLNAVLEFGMVSEDTLNVVLEEGDPAIFDGHKHLNQRAVVILAEVYVISLLKQIWIVFYCQNANVALSLVFNVILETEKQHRKWVEQSVTTDSVLD